MRHLAYFAAGFSAAVFCCHYDVHWGGFVLLCAVALAAVLRRFSDGKRRSTALLLLSLGLVLGASRYELQKDRKLDYRPDLDGQVQTMSGVVTGYPVLYDTYTAVKITAEDRLGQVKPGIFYLYDGSGNGLRPGDRVAMKVRLSPVITSNGQFSDDYIAKGLYLRGNIDRLDVIGRVPLAGLRYAPEHLGEFLRQTMGQYLPESSAAFMKALITGRQNDLFRQTQVHHALSDAGLMHVVAVSGMHVSFLVALAFLLLGAHRGWKLALVLMALFAVMTGLSPSVLRALFMQSVFLMGPVLKRESDGLTSVLGALLVLLLFNPFAVGSLSLQLSFAAVLGLVLLTPRMLSWFQEKGHDLKGKRRKLYDWVTASLSTSLGAMAFSAFPAAVVFGQISLLAPLSNLLVLWLIPLCFAGGFLLGAAALICRPLAYVAAQLLHGLISVVLLLAKGVAVLPLAAVTLPKGLTICWFLGSYTVLSLAYFCKKGKQFRPLVPVCTCLLALFILLLGTRSYYRMGTTLGAVDVGQGQCIVILDEDRTLMVDCGGRYDAGDRIIRWLRSHGRQRVDVLILTHFDTDHSNAVEQLMEQMPVGQLLFNGEKLEPHEAERYHRIHTLAREKDVRTSHISAPTQFRMNDLQVVCHVLDDPGGNRGIAVLASVDDRDILITGDMSIEDEFDLMQSDRFPDGEYLVAGHHGSKHSTGTLLLDEFQPEQVIISCGHNHFGHPTKEVLHRLEARNMVVYRTDLLGNVELKVR